MVGMEIFLKHGEFLSKMTPLCMYEVARFRGKEMKGTLKKHQTSKDQNILYVHIYRL